MNRRTVHLVHVPKTGGTVLKHALREYRLWNGGTIVLHGHDTGLGDVPPGDRVMFFLRDPLTRFVSAFYSRQRKGYPRFNGSWKPGEREAFERFQTPNELARTLSSSDRAQRELAWSAMGNIQHLRSTLTWLESEAYLRSRLEDIFYIGFQETLDRDFEGLKRKLGLPVELRLSGDEVEAHRNPARLDCRLDDLGVGNLREWYEADWRVVDFCRGQAPRVNGGKWGVANDPPPTR